MLVRRDLIALVVSTQVRRLWPVRFSVRGIFLQPGMSPVQVSALFCQGRVVLSRTGSHQSMPICRISAKGDGLDPVPGCDYRGCATYFHGRTLDANTGRCVQSDFKKVIGTACTGEGVAIT